MICVEWGEMCDVPMWVRIDGGYVVVRGMLWVFFYVGETLGV